MNSSSKPGKSFTVQPVSRWRWNVLDLIQICNRGSVPSYLFADIDMSYAEHLRAELRKRGHKVTVTAILLKAIGIAQAGHPDARTAMLPFGHIVTINDIVASFTVEKLIDGQAAVYFGTIKSPEAKSIQQIAKELRDHAELEVTDLRQTALEHRFAKMPWLFRQLILLLGTTIPSMRLRYMDATFGLTSLGKYGIKALIPPPVCAATFGVGNIESTPVVRGGEIAIRPMMQLSLVFDHRLIDGAPAARFMQDVRLLLEGGLEKHLGESLDDQRFSTDHLALPAGQATISPIEEPATTSA